MIEQDYLRAGIRLAKRWHISGFTSDGEQHVTVYIEGFGIDLRNGELEPFLKDALAAQLVRQIRAIPDRGGFLWIELCREIRRTALNKDVTMTTIMRIVDNGVLK